HGTGADLPPLDLGLLVGAALTLTQRLDAAYLALEASPKPAQPRVGFGPPEVDLSPVLALDRTGDTFYDCDYALILDRVGNDLYDDNAGGSWLAIGNIGFFFLSGEPNRCASRIDPLSGPVGSPQPSAAVGGEFEFGLLITASLLLDDDGDDTYGVAKVPNLDAECTHDLIPRRVGAQGAGIIGVGILADTAGSNTFLAKTLSQGMGHGGIGLMYLGSGDDTLRAVRSAQGVGVFGGWGVLVNEGGHDQYLSYMPAGGTLNIDLGVCDDTSRYMQGSAFGRVTGVATGVLGLLHDRGGDDVYACDGKCQGAAAVFAAAALVDDAGDDAYRANLEAMGYGEGHSSTGGLSAGVLVDRAGDDTYLIGAAPGIGQGDGQVRDPMGAPAPYVPPNLWANDLVAYFVDPLLVAGGGLLLDDGHGRDAYSLPGRADDTTLVTPGLAGLFVDR
ncbi:MAG: hypothetical protein LC624_00030, partial [Halobacteriales archaeon]|nr:hypothetical protein [Halobacteriales archaeon]